MNAVPASIPPNASARRGPAPSRATLWLIVALLAAPVVLALSLYASGWHPQGRPRGELLQPVRPLPAGVLQATAPLRGKWVLLLAADGCADDCAPALDALRRVQVALNKDMGRVRRAVIAAAPGAFAEASARQPDLAVLPLAPDWNAGGNAVYVVDPDGALLLRYPLPLAARDLQRDLERLLRFSWLG